MKKLLALCLTALLIGSCMLPMAAFATETEGTTAPTESTTAPTRPKDACGDGLTWSFRDGVLTVSGSGAMDDYSGSTPWDDHKQEITTVVFTGGVTYVGAYAFRDCNKLVAIDFGGSMHTIGERAFQSCEGLTVIHLPATFRRFASESFEGCTALTEVYCAGGMPSFNFNCLWNYSSITVYCPVNNPWPASAVQELETNFGGRLQVLSADGEDIFDFDTEEPAQETTEPTTAPTTEPATEPATEPSTVPTTEPVTESTTEAATETTEETEAATEATTEASEEPATEPAVTEPQEPEGLAGKSWIAVLIIAGVLTFLVGGALIFRASRRGGKYAA